MHVLLKEREQHPQPIIHHRNVLKTSRGSLPTGDPGITTANKTEDPENEKGKNTEINSDILNNIINTKCVIS